MKTVTLIRASLFVFLGAVAATFVCSHASAGPKKIASPPAPAGVSLESYDVHAKCGQTASYAVTMRYDLKAPAQAVVSLPTGDQTLDLPAGHGTKAFTFTGKTLLCGGSGENLLDVLLTQALFEGKSFMPKDVVGVGTPVPVGG